MLKDATIKIETLPFNLWSLNKGVPSLKSSTICIHNLHLHYVKWLFLKHAFNPINVF